MEKFITKECKNHGLTEHVLEGRGFYRCKRCRTDAVTRRRKKLKHMAVVYKGSECERCGYCACAEAMDFHHADGDKEFGIAKSGHTRSWGRLKKELDKCMLLCARCHREIHAGFIGKLNPLKIDAGIVKEAVSRGIDDTIETFPNIDGVFDEPDQLKKHVTDAILEMLEETFGR